MDLDAIEGIGLTRNEAKVYVELLRCGPVSAGELAKKVGIHRSRVYEALDRIMDRGLAESVIVSKKRSFQARDPNALIGFLDEKREMLKQMVPDLKKLQARRDTQQEVHTYQGVGGLKVLLREALKTKEYLVFGAPKESVDIMKPFFWKNHNLKRMEAKIRCKMIFNEELRQWADPLKNRLTQIRFLRKAFHNLTETIIFDCNVAIIVWSPKPLGILIKDQDLADSYRSFFEVMWNQARS